MPDEQTNSNNQTQQTPPANGQQPPKETVKEIHHYHVDHGSRFFPRLFWGLLVIFIGLVFLSQSAGVITGVEVGRFFATVWPILIILVGLSIMSRGGFISGLVSTLILVAILGLVFLYVVGVPVFGGRIRIGQNNTQQIKTSDISIDKAAAAQSADISIKAGAGQINVYGNSEKLVSGSLVSNFNNIDVSSQASGNTQNVNIRTTNTTWNFGGHFTNDLTVSLSSLIPIDLNIDAGAASQNLDLSDVQITNLDINAGASSVNLVLGDKTDDATVSVDGGASSVHITLPKTLGAKVTADGGLTSKDFADFTKLGDNTYQSKNYDQSDKKVSITLHGGASSYTIDWK